MQLKIQRSQRMGGVFAGTVVFCLDVRADYSAEERDNINKYKLGGEVIYNSQAARKHLEQAGTHLDRAQSRDLKEQFGGLARGAFSLALAKMSLNISIASLGRGHHIECKDLNELLEAEDTVRDACKNVTRFLQVAETFDGSEVVVEYENGEERVHIAQPVPAMIGHDTERPRPAPVEAEFDEKDAAEPEFGGTATMAASPPDDLFMELGRYIRLLASKFAEQWQQLRPKIAEFVAAKNWSGLKQNVAEFAAAENWHALKQKIGEFVASKEWTKRPAQAVERLKQRWSGFEQRCLAFGESKGWPLGTMQVRAASGAMAFLLVSALIALAYEVV